MTFVLLLFDSREASKLTSLSTTCRKKVGWRTRKSRLFIPTGQTWRTESNPNINLNNFQGNMASESQVCLTTACLLLFPDLFVSSVNERQLGSYPGLAPWAGPHGSSWSFHSPSWSSVKKKSTQRTQWVFFQDTRSESKAGAVGGKAVTSRVRTALP